MICPGLGKCSLTAAISGALDDLGVQACPLPTAVLSAQTGFPSYYCDDYTDRMDIHDGRMAEDAISVRTESTPDFWQVHYRQRRQWILYRDSKVQRQRFW